MPVTLNPLEPGFDEPTKNSKRRLMPTSVMVEDALIELHNAKGVTLKQVYNFILSNHNMESLSKQRIALIKKHLISLRESEDIANKTGKGLLGHFKLVDKRQFILKVRRNNKQTKENLNATARAKASYVRDSKSNNNANNKNDKITSKSKIRKRTIKKPLNNKQIAPVIPRQVTPYPLRNNASMFDTPLVPTQVHASTPIISTGFIPPAPQVNKKEKRKKVPQDDSGTPRSTLSAKKRKLLNRPEKVY